MQAALPSDAKGDGEAGEAGEEDGGEEGDTDTDDDSFFSDEEEDDEESASEGDGAQPTTEDLLNRIK